LAEPRPLVSCLMPTRNRRAFVPLAIRYFCQQDYPKRELIIIDDGTDPVEDLVPAGDPRIRYVRLDAKQTVGEKRNLACCEAHGEILLHWDDDDWYASHRVSYQVGALLRVGADVCGLRSLVFYDLTSSEAYLYTYPANRKRWVSGSTLCYTRALWEQNPFPAIDVGEDAQFLWSSVAKKVAVLEDSSIHVAMIHAGNVSPKRVTGSYWAPYPVEAVAKLLGEDWAAYRSWGPPGSAMASAQVAVARAPEARALGATCPEAPALHAPGAFDPDLALAREEHLAYPEFLAANRGADLPRMRRWEIPFALSQARLGENMAVLDCTINPAGFRERLLALFPNTLYRHWNPIQNGSFAMPFGFSDEAFDRVVCINTLEHLLKPQRAALVRGLARCLKPGGLLVLTTDHYFDSLWERPEVLRSGVVRSDREEVFGGWNQVPLAEWAELGAAGDLYPLLTPAREPRADEPGLYRNLQPYDHGTMGGVFVKGAVAVPHRRVVLSLLTWNTRNVSLESAHAYIREARMLRRLGCDPCLCICDNGSTDGTAEALRQVEQELEMPHRFIYNATNLGNSIARNQIIDYVLECGADYLLFMDGDIEVVPFSSFAMLRYLESRGHRLGCIGADSAGQTQQRERAAPCLFSVEECRTEAVDLVAWTQYGMFRRAVFEAGVRFDETGPMGKPGWGFEDNDLAFQLEARGFVNQRFFGMTYLHRAPRSSTRNLRAEGIDPNPLFEERKQHVVTKWAGVPVIEQGPLSIMRRIQVRL
jgi:glycosyltransferase involved in cell wall biosynthesis/SAM-dependent methyltransferase